MIPGVPGVAGVPGVLAAATALAAGVALALLLLGGLEGVAAGVVGVPGIEVAVGTKGAPGGAPIGDTPGGMGMPLARDVKGPEVTANGGTGLYEVAGSEAYADGGPSCGDGRGRPLVPA